MSKKSNLAAALQKVSGKKSGEAVPAPAPQVVIEQPAKADVSAGSSKPPSRTGKKVVAGHFDPAVVKQLKQLALNQDSSVQALLTEALNDLFEKYSLKPIA